MSSTLSAAGAGVTRRLAAARKRAMVARSRADRRPTDENLTAAAELEAGLARMQAEL